MTPSLNVVEFVSSEETMQGILNDFAIFIIGEYSSDKEVKTDIYELEKILEVIESILEKAIFFPSLKTDINLVISEEGLSEEIIFKLVSL
jgi:hypothetical protein